MIKQFNDISLLAHNTFGIEANAAHFVEFSSVNGLVEFLGSGFKGKSLVIGGGSNLLFVKDFDGTVFHSSIQDIEIVEETATDILLRVGGGLNWDKLVEYTVEKGWSGLENLSLIPGEVGASAVQNVGAYGVEAGDLIEKVETIRIADAMACSFTKADCNFSYRHSIFKAAEKGRHIVTYVTYKLKKSPHFILSYGNIKEKVEELGGATLANVRRAVCDVRKAKLPNPDSIGSAGSFFMNPVVAAEKAAQLKNEYPSMPQYPLPTNEVKLSAGWMIEQCGWKQKPNPRVGVYPHQALVVVNLGGATGKDVLDFATMVVASVKEQFGVELKMEVNVIE